MCPISVALFCKELKKLKRITVDLLIYTQQKSSSIQFNFNVRVLKIWFFFQICYSIKKVNIFKSLKYINRVFKMAFKADKVSFNPFKMSKWTFQLFFRILYYCYIVTKMEFLILERRGHFTLGVSFYVIDLVPKK